MPSPNTVVAKPGAPCALPAEVWGQVLDYVDTFTLWTVCRQVSRILRYETEGLVARNRLSTLSIRWHEESPGWEKCLLLKTKALLRLSENGSRAHFSLWTGYVDFTSAITNEEVEGFAKLGWSTTNIDKVFAEAIKFNDLEFAQRFDERQLPDGLPWRELHITFDQLVNDCDIPSLNVSSDWKEVSFDWKELINRIFWNEQYICHELRKVTGSAVQPYPVRAARSIETKEQRSLWCCGGTWAQDYDDNDESFYQQALLTRVERSYRAAGKPLDQEEVSRLRDGNAGTLFRRGYRNIVILEHLVATRPAEFGTWSKAC